MTSYEGSNYAFQRFLILRQKRCVFVTKQVSVSARISLETHLFRYGNWLVYQHGCKRRMEPTTTHQPQPFLMTRHVRKTRASSHVEQGRLDPSHVERHRVTWNKAASIQATWNKKWPSVRFDTSHAQQEGPFSQTALTKATQRSPLCIHQHLYTRI